MFKIDKKPKIPKSPPKARAPIDEIMKYLFSVSKETLINMLNSLFNQKLKIDDTTVIQTNSEFVDENFDITRGDLFFRLTEKLKPHNFHIEVETRLNGNMTIRVLEYDIKKADEHQRLENKSFVKRYVLPKSIVIHIEKGRNIPDCYESEIVDIKPDGSEEIIHRSVSVIKYWELSESDLIKRKLYPLLPMQVFLLRGELKKYAKSKNLKAKQEVISKVKKLTEKIITEAHKLAQEGKIDDGDDDKIITALDKLIKYLNKQYDFDEKLNQEVDTVIESVFTRLKRKGREENKIETAKKMILKNKPLEEIIEFSDLPEKKIREIAKKLSKEIIVD